MAAIYNPPAWTAGDDESVIFRKTDAEGNPVDLSGYIGSMHIRRDATSPLEAAATAEFPVDDAGLVVLKFTPDVTGNFRNSGGGEYQYDIELVSPEGITKTEIRGKVTVDLDITRGDEPEEESVGTGGSLTESLLGG